LREEKAKEEKLKEDRVREELKEKLKEQNKKPKFFQALFDYYAQEASELSFKEGATILLIDDFGEPNAWWKGQNTSNHAVGMFPSNFVKPI